MKARAFAANMQDSGEASATFTIALPTVATPTITPAGGSFSGPVSVTLASTTSGATIRYTTNGTTPTNTAASTLYGGAFTVSATSTVKARAFATNMQDSGEASATFTIALPTVATPTISPAGGSFAVPATVTLASTTAGATIRYTTNGTTPTNTTASTLYAGPFSVAATSTVKARAFASSMNDSAEASATFTITALPTVTKILPLGDSTTYGLGTSNNSGYRLPLWTLLNGYNVNFVGPFQQGPTNLMDVDHAGYWGRNMTQISQALNGWLTTYRPDMVLLMAGLTDIDQNLDLANAPNRLTTIIDQIYAIQPNASVIVAQITPWFGNATKDQQTATFNAAIPAIVAQKAAAGRRIAMVDLYNAVTKTTADFADPIHPNANGYAKIANVWFAEISRQLSTTTATVATPTITPAGGSFSGPVSVTLASATSGATIRYTTDGTTPTNTAASTLYGGAFTISGTSTVKARAFATNMQDSVEASATFTIALPTVATPTITPAGGSFSGPVSVTLASATSGATIRYTTDGTTPTNTAASTLYGGAFTVSATSTVKARAFAANMQDSGEASVTFTIALPTVATPTISPTGGSFSGPVSVTLTSATSGATIRYTTNGTTPTNTAASTLYGGAFTVSATSTVKARAFAANMQDSGEASVTFTIALPTVATPTITPVWREFLGAGVGDADVRDVRGDDSLHDRWDDADQYGGVDAVWGSVHRLRDEHGEGARVCPEHAGQWRSQRHLHHRAADGRDADDEPDRWQFHGAGVGDAGVRRRRGRRFATRPTGRRRPIRRRRRCMAERSRCPRRAR